MWAWWSFPGSVSGTEAGKETPSGQCSFLQHLAQVFAPGVLMNLLILLERDVVQGLLVTKFLPPTRLLAHLQHPGL